MYNENDITLIFFVDYITVEEDIFLHVKRNEVDAFVLGVSGDFASKI